MAIQIARRAILSREQQLVGAIIGADWSAGASQTLDPALFHDIDWSKLPQLAWQHKIRPMMAATLRNASRGDLPADIRASVESAERACSLKTMAQLQVLTEIAALAQARGLRVLTLKGVALSLYLYDDPFIREAYDLDFLVASDDSEAFDQVLRTAGCVPSLQDPPLSPQQMEILKRFRHDKKYIHAGAGVVIESHYALVNNPNLIGTDFDVFWPAREHVFAGKQAVAMLGLDDLVRYLGVHAAVHRWERWKWIADMVALFRRMDVHDLVRLRERSQAEGNRHLFDGSILLAYIVAGLALPQMLVDAAASDRRADALVARALRVSTCEYQQTDFSKNNYIFSHVVHGLWLKRSWRYLAYELVSLFHHEGDWYKWRLPDRLIWLYYLLRPVFYVWRRARVPGWFRFKRRKIK